MTDTQLPISQQWLDQLKADHAYNPVLQGLSLDAMAASKRIRPIESQEQLDAFKAAFPGDADLQALSLAEIQARAAGTPIDWAILTLRPPRGAPGGIRVTSCDIAIASVVIDIVMIAIGASGLAGKVSGEAAEEVAEELVKSLGDDITEIDSLIQKVRDAATSWDKAKAVFNILAILKDVGCLSAVIGAIFRSLSWWDMILYGLTAFATIVALIATDGVAFIAEVAILVASGAFLMEDVYHAIKICSTVSPVPPPMPWPPFDTTGGLQTVNGHYMTIVNGGAIGDKVAALNTDHPSIVPDAIFTWVSVDPVQKTFALRCPDGVHYLTANNGGGIGGPKNHDAPVHADATQIGAWETLTLVNLGDNRIAIESYKQYYVTAVNGGGWTDPKRPFRTDATAIGPWETFKFHD